jgi:hypothetical protein
MKWGACEGGRGRVKWPAGSVPIDKSTSNVKRREQYLVLGRCMGEDAMGGEVEERVRECEGMVEIEESDSKHSNMLRGDVLL